MNFFYFYTCFNLNCNLGGSRTTFPLTAHNQLEYTLNIVHGSSALCVYKFLMQKMPETEVFRPDNCICHKRLNPFFHLSRLSLFDDIKVCADNPFTCFPYFFLPGIGGNLVSIQASRISTNLHLNFSHGEVPEDHKRCHQPCSTFFGSGKVSNSSTIRG